MTDSDHSESTLAAQMVAAQTGDADAYRALLRSAGAIAAATARRRGLRDDRVDDAVQETLITIHRARHTYDPARPFLPWLRAIADRRAIDVARRQVRQSAREVHNPIAYEQHPDQSADAVHDVALGAARRAVTDALALLPPGQREAVEHLALAERSLEETARLTGRSKGALKVNLHRALKALRARIGSGGDV